MSKANTLLGFQGAGVAANEEWTNVCSKTSRHASMSTYRSAMLSVAALAVKGRRKNTTRSETEVWSFFQAACFTLAAMFLRTKQVIDEYLFTCSV